MKLTAHRRGDRHNKNIGAKKKHPETVVHTISGCFFLRSVYAGKANNVLYFTIEVITEHINSCCGNGLTSFKAVVSAAPYLDFMFKCIC